LDGPELIFQLLFQAMEKVSVLSVELNGVAPIVSFKSVADALSINKMHTIKIENVFFIYY
jgi:hypothetical protein